VGSGRCGRHLVAGLFGAEVVGLAGIVPGNARVHMADEPGMLQVGQHTMTSKNTRWCGILVQTLCPLNTRPWPQRPPRRGPRRIGGRTTPPTRDAPTPSSPGREADTSRAHGRAVTARTQAILGGGRPKTTPHRGVLRRRRSRRPGRWRRSSVHAVEAVAALTEPVRLCEKFRVRTALWLTVDGLAGDDQRRADIGGQGMERQPSLV
jgi:hypothetical protein